MIDRRDGAVHVVRVNADDDVDLAAALVDHFDVDVRVGERGEDSCRGSRLIAHTVSDDGDQRDVPIDVNEIGVGFAADAFDDLVQFAFHLFVRNDDAHRIDTGGHMLEVDVVIFEYRQDFTAEADFAVHHGFFDENRRESLLPGDTGDKTGRDDFGGVLDNKRADSRRIERILDIDRNARRLQREGRFRV